MYGRRESLTEVRAAQLRARLLRRGIQQFFFATLFLMGGLSFALGPDAAAPSSHNWMIALTAISTLHFAMGMRVFTRVRRYPRRLWPVATFTWVILMATVLRYLVAAD